MVKFDVLFEVRPEFLNIIQTSFGFKMVNVSSTDDFIQFIITISQDISINELFNTFWRRESELAALDMVSR
jgi:hypothetical protein